MTPMVINRSRSPGIVAGLRSLEREQEIPSHRRRIIESLEPARNGRPLIVSEIASLHPHRQNDIVIIHRLLPELDLLAREVDPSHFFHQHRDIVLIGKNAPNRMCNLGSRQPGRSDLVEKRLKKVMILTVDQQNLDVFLLEHLGAFNTRESPAKDHDFWLFHEYPSYLCGVSSSRSDPR